jgi:hypothetical protein
MFVSDVGRMSTVDLMLTTPGLARELAKYLSEALGTTPSA